MKPEKLKKVLRSSDLAQYKLNRHLLGVLARVDQMREYNIKAGRSNADAIRLYGQDYNDINRAVREQSGAAFHAGTVTYRGMPLISQHATVPPFSLEVA